MSPGRKEILLRTLTEIHAEATKEQEALLQNVPPQFRSSANAHKRLMALSLIKRLTEVLHEVVEEIPTTAEHTLDEPRPFQDGASGNLGNTNPNRGGSDA